MVSPNKMLEAAQKMMLDGREARTREDWELVMNFFAYNIEPKTALAACKLLAAIYNMPLTMKEVQKIVEFQTQK